MIVAAVKERLRRHKAVKGVTVSSADEIGDYMEEYGFAVATGQQILAFADDGFIKVLRRDGDGVYPDYTEDGAFAALDSKRKFSVCESWAGLFIHEAPGYKRCNAVARECNMGMLDDDSRPADFRIVYED